MPELPEAETNRRRVEKAALNRTVAEARLGENTVHVDLPSPADRRRLEGRQFTETRRHGKMVFAGSQSGPWIVVHFGMTGSLRPFEAADGAPSNTKFIVAFEGGRSLAFCCPRKLGWLRVIDDPDDWIAAEGYGPDALAIDPGTFAGDVAGGRGGVKSALMDQRKIAGLGNLWSDEVCFQAGIAPQRRCSTLSDKARCDLHRTMQTVLKIGVETGNDYGRLPDDWLMHCREAGAECPRCGGEIATDTVAGRTSFYCSRHQEGAT